MLSPKMQRTVRVNDSQLVMLSDRAHYDHSQSGYLHKRTADSGKWQLRWFVLYQNLLFYYETEGSGKPSGVLLLEGCYCERLITSTQTQSAALAAKLNKQQDPERQYCFAISYRRENQRQYELRAQSEQECCTWISAIRDASFNKLLLQKEELEQKHLHLLQVVESEKTAKWQYTQHCEELASEIKKLRAELCALKKEWRPSTPVAPSLTQQSGSSATLATSSVGSCSQPVSPTPQDNVELRKIKKVQSFFRGWLCRRRWKQIVEQYIKSPHAESMRKRNSLVFRMVEAEEEYMEQMEVLVSCFLRPFKMAASSKRPPCSHEDVNSIFLNSETVLFLHQIFLKGLTSRLESWPTLVLGDLFDMLLPMLSIYQEYVRNHHYSLQVLTECKGSAPFAALLTRLENKPACQGRSLEAFLTYPMHQIPRYIITLHELLAHTPHDHVERRSLQNARQQLEDLSRQMHDEVSETENLRKNLAVERMIVEGCDILLDVNQVFVRQGSLVQLPASRTRVGRTTRSRLASFKSEKDTLRQCFLFSNHLIIATRTSGGRLHLVPDVGKIPMADAILIEDPSEYEQNNEDASESASVCSMSSQSSEASSVTSSLHPLHSVSHHHHQAPSTAGTASSAASATNGNQGIPPIHHRDFKILVDGKTGGQLSVHLVAPTVQEKAAWISDISQCMDNAHLHDLLTPPLSAGGGGANSTCGGGGGALRSDPKLFRDDVDIRFSRALNSCKVPQIRYATPERLLQRLTDLRFLSIDFLNTFLLTYRVFTDGETVLAALQRVFYNAEEGLGPDGEMVEGVSGSGDKSGVCGTGGNTNLNLGPPSWTGGMSSPRRVSGASSVSGYCSEGGERDRSHSVESSAIRGLRVLDEEVAVEGPRIIKVSPTTPRRSFSKAPNENTSTNHNDTCHLTIPKVMATSSSSDTLTEATVMSGPSSPGNLSSVTLVGSTNSDHQQQIQESEQNKTNGHHSPRRSSALTITTSASASNRRGSSTFADQTIIDQSGQTKPGLQETHFTYDETRTVVNQTRERRPSGYDGEQENRENEPPNLSNGHGGGGGGRAGGLRCQQSNGNSSSDAVKVLKDHNAQDRKSEPKLTPEHHCSPLFGPRHSISSLRRTSDVDCNASEYSYYTGYTPRGSLGGASLLSRASVQYEQGGGGTGPGGVSSRVGVVITSSRQSQRRSSTSSAAAAFAIATSASSNPRDVPNDPDPARSRKESVLSSAATMRVLNVLRHWVSKHAQDFEQDTRLRARTAAFLDDITCSPNLLPAEHRAAAQLLRLLCRNEEQSGPGAGITVGPGAGGKVNLEKLLAPSPSPSKESIETLSALEIAEQMTYLDHQIFMSIRSEEFLGQAWMKSDKAVRAPHILLMTRRFNDVSRLVVSEIVRRPGLQARTQAIEKWAAVADISRCLHNFNGVLQVCAAFTNSSVFRLKKTWEKVSKTTRQTIAKLQRVVSSDGRFRVLRDALHRCDPPCIPYLGLYLTDLSFIEEGTPDFTPDGLLNFSKMRMIAHVIREIRHFQQTPYKIENIPKVTNYLLDASLLLDDDELYRLSLQIEPRTSRLSTTS